MSIFFSIIILSGFILSSLAKTVAYKVEVQRSEDVKSHCADPNLSKVDNTEPEVNGEDKVIVSTSKNDSSSETGSNVSESSTIIKIDKDDNLSLETSENIEDSITEKTVKTSKNLVQCKLPVVEWILSSGKCKNCKKSISFQLPIVEVLTAILFVLAFFKMGSFGLETAPYILSTVAVCIFIVVGLSLAMIDFKTMILPTKMIYYTLGLVALLLVIASIIDGDFNRLLFMLIGSIGSFVFYFIIWFIQPKGMGFGDVRLALLTGALLGWISLSSAVVGLMLPYIVLCIAVLPLMIIKKVTRKTRVPFGPWMIYGTIAAVFFGDIIANTYLKLGGLL